MIKIDSSFFLESGYSDQHSLRYLLQSQLEQNSLSTEKYSNKTFPPKSKKIAKITTHEQKSQQEIKKKRTFKGFWSK